MWLFKKTTGHQKENARQESCSLRYQQVRCYTEQLTGLCCAINQETPPKSEISSGDINPPFFFKGTISIISTPFIQYGSASFDKHNQLYGYCNIQNSFITAQIPLSLYSHPVPCLQTLVKTFHYVLVSWKQPTSINVRSLAFISEGPRILIHIQTLRGLDVSQR